MFWLERVHLSGLSAGWSDSFTHPQLQSKSLLSHALPYLSNNHRFLRPMIIYHSPPILGEHPPNEGETSQWGRVIVLQTKSPVKLVRDEKRNGTGGNYERNIKTYFREASIPPNDET